MGFVVLTGASGSGKTAIAESIAARHGEHVDVYHFDQVGVPSLEHMIVTHGSGEGWQRAMTFEWMAKIAATRHVGRHTLFEGQMRLSFVVEAAAAAGIANYAVILVDCDDATRTKRIKSNKRRANLANPAMMNWAKHLRDEAKQLRCAILDTTQASLEACVELVLARLCQ